MAALNDSVELRKEHYVRLETRPSHAYVRPAVLFEHFAYQLASVVVELFAPSDLAALQRKEAVLTDMMHQMASQDEVVKEVQPLMAA